MAGTENENGNGKQFVKVYFGNEKLGDIEAQFVTYPTFNYMGYEPQSSSFDAGGWGSEGGLNFWNREKWAKVLGYYYSLAIPMAVKEAGYGKSVQTGSGILGSLAIGAIITGTVPTVTAVTADSALTVWAEKLPGGWKYFTGGLLSVVEPGKRVDKLIDNCNLAENIVNSTGEAVKSDVFQVID